MNKHIIMVLILLFSNLIFWNCNITEPSEDYGFGIYLLKDTTLTTSGAKARSLKSLTLQDDDPLIDLADIVTYNWEDHLIDLTNEACERMGRINEKIKSIYGLPFIFIARREKIYLGNIYPAYSSYIHPDLPFITVAPFIELQIIRAPSKEAADQRIDDRIYQVLEKQEKLRD